MEERKPPSPYRPVQALVLYSTPRPAALVSKRHETVTLGPRPPAPGAGAPCPARAPAPRRRCCGQQRAERELQSGSDKGSSAEPLGGAAAGRGAGSEETKRHRHACCYTRQDLCPAVCLPSHPPILPARPASDLASPRSKMRCCLSVSKNWATSRWKPSGSGHVCSSPAREGRGRRAEGGNGLGGGVGVRPRVQRRAKARRLSGPGRARNKG